MVQTETGSFRPVSSRLVSSRLVSFRPVLTMTIDGVRFSDLDSSFDGMSERMIPDARWGSNLDAFNDILRGRFGTADSNFGGSTPMCPGSDWGGTRPIDAWRAS